MKRSMNRKWLAIGMVCLMVLLAACGKTGTDVKTEGTASGDGAKKPTVGYYVNSTLGDKSFFDSVKRGVDQAASELGYEAKTIEGGNNQADWPAGLESMITSKKYDVIVVGTSQMIDLTKELAAKYPDQKFIFYDDAIADMPNVYSMIYSQSEGSFLAGAFAALVTTSTELTNSNPEKVIGFIGGMNVPIINDFKSGYEQGAHYIDKDVQIVSSYIGNFYDAPKGKELSLAMYNGQKADIVYQVAAAGGLGVLEAGSELGKYSIGVDSNQNGLYPGSVLTSMLKNLDSSTFRALQMFKEDKLPFGKVELLGVKEDGVGLAADKLYEEHVPQAIRDKMKEVEDKLRNGEIKVESALD